MGKESKILKAAKANPASLSFSELRRLTVAAGFVLARIRGSHHVYSKTGVVEIIDLQPLGHAAKAYQVKQVLSLIEKYSIVID